MQQHKSKLKVETHITYYDIILLRTRNLASNLFTLSEGIHQRPYRDFPHQRTCLTYWLCVVILHGHPPEIKIKEVRLKMWFPWHRWKFPSITTKTTDNLFSTMLYTQEAAGEFCHPFFSVFGDGPMVPGSLLNKQTDYCNLSFVEVLGMVS